MNDIEAELAQAFSEVQSLIAVLRAQAQDMGIDVMHMQDATDRYMMAELIVAKAQILPVLHQIRAQREWCEEVATGVQKAKEAFLEGWNKGETRVINDD